MAVEPRQQASSASNSQSATTAASSASNTGSASGVTSAPSGSATGTGTASGSSSLVIGITGGPGYNASASHASTIPANGNAGQIVFTQPSPFSTSFYKVASGEYVTFGWNFTYLAVTPSSLTVSAACEDGNTYPVGPTDGVIPGDSQSVVWYPYGYQQNHSSLPLVQASYTLLIWGSGGPSAPPTPGYLEANSQLKFALYTPQPYVPLTSWTCPGCGSAMGRFQAHPASIALITTLLIVFLSGFTTLRRVWD